MGLSRLRLLLFGSLLIGYATHLPAGPTLDDAREAYLAGHTAESVEIFHEVAALAEESGEAATAGIAYNNACVILTNLGNLVVALDDCRSALELRRPLDDARALARTHNNLGLVLQHLAQFEEAPSVSIATGATSPARPSIWRISVSRRLRPVGIPRPSIFTVACWRPRVPMPTNPGLRHRPAWRGSTRPWSWNVSGPFVRR